MEGQIAHFLARRPDPGELKTLLNAIESGDEVWAGGNFLLYLKGIEIPGIRYASAPKETLIHLTYHITEKVVNFADKVVGDQRVGDLLSSGRATFFHYQNLRFKVALYGVFSIAEEVKIVSSGKERVFFYGNNPVFNYPGVLPGNTACIMPFNQVGKNKTKGYLFAYLTKITKRILFSFFRKKPPKDRHLLLDGPMLTQPLLDPESLKTVPGNLCYSFLLRHSPEKFALIDELNPPSVSEETKVYALNINKLDGSEWHNSPAIFGEWVWFRYGFFPANLFCVFREHFRLKRVYEKIEKACSTPVDRMIIREVRKHHSTTLFFLFKHLAYKRFFKTNRYPSLTGYPEYPGNFKCIFDAAKANGIPTLGVQHGAIFDHHIGYLYTPDDQIRKVPVDYTLVWGEMTRKVLLEKGNFSPESVIALGQPRTDVVAKISKLSRQELLNNEADQRYWVAFASQPLANVPVREAVNHAVFAAAALCPEVTLVLKRHPNDPPETYFNQIAEKEGCSNYKILNIDLYLVLAASDLVVTNSSTVGQEGLYFGKPLVIIDPSAEDLADYIKDGVAVQAVTPQDLAQWIEKYRLGKLKLNTEVVEPYIAQKVFKIDGLVTERYVNFIKEVAH